ncbi:hypothetical protein I4F81_001310 [Pyropia yezoensis]|uniref:Uncharacterized protein n=1 Tax=Pyropia yezoensis TaxID=2788 RepID=A0ACC3BL53_PYRYE|nr:hypothetical protein I4F81_001310 [Neopyropia yezoensis]
MARARFSSFGLPRRDPSRTQVPAAAAHAPLPCLVPIVHHCTVAHWPTTHPTLHHLSFFLCLLPRHPSSPSPPPSPPCLTHSFSTMDERPTAGWSTTSAPKTGSSTPSAHAPPAPPAPAATVAPSSTPSRPPMADSAGPSALAPPVPPSPSATVASSAPPPRPPMPTSAIPSALLPPIAPSPPAPVAPSSTPPRPRRRKGDGVRVFRDGRGRRWSPWADAREWIL